MTFKEYLQVNADDSIEQVMSGEWISKGKITWKATDDEDNSAGLTSSMNCFIK